MPDMGASFECLVEPHFGALYRAAVRLTRQRHDAEDLVQEVCLRAHAHIGELGAVASPRAWLMRALYHLFIDTMRHRNRSPFVRWQDDDVLARPSEDPSPERASDASRSAERLAAVWNRLEPDQRALLALHAEGHSLDELAEVFGITKNALSARLHRARLQLGMLLRRDEERPALNLVEKQS